MDCETFWHFGEMPVSYVMRDTCLSIYDVESIGICTGHVEMLLIEAEGAYSGFADAEVQGVFA